MTKLNKFSSISALAFLLFHSLGFGMEIDNSDVQSGTSSGARLVKLYVDMMAHAHKSALFFEDNDIDAEGAQSLAEALKVDKTLTTLFINGNDLSSTGTQSLAEALKINKALTYLSLDGNFVGDAVAQFLAEALKVNQTLTGLSLEQNEISDVGAQFFAEALKFNRTLTDLCLKFNQIGSEGLQSLAKALKANKILTQLNLQYNQKLDAKGAKARKEIARQLDINGRLPEIFRGNWPRIKQLFIIMGAKDLDSVISSLPKEVILQILGTVMDLEKL